MAQLGWLHATGVCKSKGFDGLCMCENQRTGVYALLRMGTGRGQKLQAGTKLTVPALELPGQKPRSQSSEIAPEWGLPVVYLVCVFLQLLRFPRVLRLFLSPQSLLIALDLPLPY